MKKIILILSIFLLSGCYDYNELTDLGIVSAMLIDYKDDKYSVNLEILDTNKDVVKPSYFLEGTGSTFESALIDIYNKSATHVYLHHMDTVILSDSIAGDKLPLLYDYFLRDPDIRKDSFFVISHNIDDFLKYESLDNLSIGESIKNIIKYNQKENADFKTSLFSDILHSYLNKSTYFIGDIEIKNNLITLGDTYIVEDNKLGINLDKSAILCANILDNSSTSFIITTNDSYEIYKYKTQKKVDNNKIVISLSADVRLFGMTEERTKSQSDLSSQENIVSSYLKKLVLESIKYSIDNNTDIYNFNYYYRIYKPLDEKKTFKDLDYDIKVDISLNERGLILDTLRRS